MSTCALKSMTGARCLVDLGLNLFVFSASFANANGDSSGSSATADSLRCWSDSYSSGAINAVGHETRSFVFSARVSANLIAVFLSGVAFSECYCFAPKPESPALFFVRDPLPLPTPIFVWLTFDRSGVSLSKPGCNFRPVVCVTVRLSRGGASLGSSFFSALAFLLDFFTESSLPRASRFGSATVDRRTPKASLAVPALVRPLGLLACDGLLVPRVVSGFVCAVLGVPLVAGVWAVGFEAGALRSVLTRTANLRVLSLLSSACSALSLAVYGRIPSLFFFSSLVTVLNLYLE